MELNRIGVCSWSLRPQSPEDLVEKVRACGLSAVQLALDPIRTWSWRPEDAGSRLRTAGIRLMSGMMAMNGEDYSTLDTIKATGGVRPDSTWEENLRSAEGNAIMAMRLGIGLVTFHAGFLSHEGDNTERAVMIERLRKIAELFAARLVRVALETGQESADTLLGVLDEVNSGLPASGRMGVNFDPANMILYGMGDPIEALGKLLPHVMQVHIKDAVATKKPGTWGDEKPAGSGSVDWSALLPLVPLACNLVVEREGGDSRVDDVRAARDLLLREGRR